MLDIERRSFWTDEQQAITPVGEPFCMEQSEKGNCLISGQLIIIDFSKLDTSRSFKPADTTSYYMGNAKT